MVAVARHQQKPAGGTQPSRIPDFLMQPKRSPIAQRLAAEEAARLERARLASRRRATVDPGLRLVNSRPLFETARTAAETRTHHGIVDCYVRRSHRQPPTPFSAATLIPAPVRIGRSTQDHYRRLHTGRMPSFRRMRVGRPGGQSLIGSIHGRVAIATLAALILIIGAFGSTLAQQRYEVQQGDTLQSVADTFGVDPAAIAASSWMPNGDSLEAGQVIVIPDPGQSPSEAAAMAAAQEGTSPWVVGAWWVDPGDTLDSIGAVYGLTGAQLAEFNGIDDPSNLQIGARILIPLSRDDNTAAVTTVRQPDVAVPGMIFYPQSRNLSCEFAATYIATAAFGEGVPEDVFIRDVPIRLNPHLGYRGNIDGLWGNTDDYGVYPEALAPVLNAHGFTADIFYSLGDTSQLTANIDAGHPVVVWLGMWGDTRERLSDDGTYSVAAGMHVMTAYGYDEEGLYLSDPAHGEEVFYTWDTFVSMWSVLDGMAMAVYPQQS